METLTEKCSGAWHELWQRPQYLLHSRGGSMMNAVGHRTMPMVFLRISDSIETEISRRIRASSRPMALDLLSEVRQVVYMRMGRGQVIDSFVFRHLSMPLINFRLAIVEPLKTELKRSAWSKPWMD